MCEIAHFVSNHTLKNTLASLENALARNWILTGRLKSFFRVGSAGDKYEVWGEGGETKRRKFEALETLELPVSDRIYNSFASQKITVGNYKRCKHFKSDIRFKRARAGGQYSNVRKSLKL